MRSDEWADPPKPVRREVLEAQPPGGADPAAPPVLFVPGYGHGAWAFAEHWLEHTAQRGFPAYAMSLRGHGGSGPAPQARLRDYVHDVTQVAAGLPRQAVLVGHGAGALVAAMAMARYPVRAGVLLAPVFGGLGTAFGLLGRNPAGTLPGIFGGRVTLTREQLFGRSLPANAGQAYARRLQRVPGGAQRQLIARHQPEAPVGAPPVLVVGSPDDRVVAGSALEGVARRYGGSPLLFPGMGHDLMLDARWQEPIDAIVDWLEQVGKGV
ncbi:alpha/beta fold hydrolase [Dactylosporangium sp. NPDC049140]|jgi:pimeloyl-ACP methyl ester carboxylesterase|uniref:alpha/beta hydrolase n=1 Tax=Dactylosporangium sp. NPDC049140 TaxID=3155647 RepID=UPI0033EAB314